MTYRKLAEQRVAELNDDDARQMLAAILLAVWATDEENDTEHMSGADFVEAVCETLGELAELP